MLVYNLTPNCHLESWSALWPHFI